MEEKRRNVVFVTATFGRGENGPQTYADYLWRHFNADPEVGFHLVAPGPEITPRRLPLLSSWQFYRDLSLRALAVADKIGRKDTIIHLNNSQLDPLILQSPYRIFGQINDYENAELPLRWKAIWRMQGARRVLSLGMRRRREQQFVRRQALTICNSRYTREAVLQAYQPISPQSVVTIYKAVDVAAFTRPASPPTDPLARDPSLHRVAYVGTDFERKGLNTLVQSIALCSARFHLAVVGPTKAEFVARYPGLASAAGLSRVSFTGRVEKDQLRQILWCSDLFVLPSRAEALGVAILEAAAAGLPVIATRVGGIPEIVEGIKAGCLIEPDSLSELIGALERFGAGEQRFPAAQSPSQFSTAGMLSAVRSYYLMDNIAEKL